MRGAPVPPAEYNGEHLDTDEKLRAHGWAAGLDVWEQMGKAYEHYLCDNPQGGALANAQMWSLQEAIKAQPRRGDAVETWIRQRRDEMGGPEDDAWRVLDDLLDQYREHADTGVPLGHELAGPHGEDG